MNFKYGKIFKNNQTQKIEVVSYMSSCDYYSFYFLKYKLLSPCIALVFGLGLFYFSVDRINVR